MSHAHDPQSLVAGDKTDGAPTTNECELELTLSPPSGSLPENKNQLGDQSTISGPSTQSTIIDEGPRPPLPPRPNNLNLLGERPFNPGGSLQTPSKSPRPKLQSTATTALARTDIHTQSYQDGSRDIYATSAESTPSGKTSKGYGSLGRFKGYHRNEGDDSASVRSYAPTLEASGDVESLLGEILGASQESPSWRLMGSPTETFNPFDSIPHEDDEATADFSREFDELDGLDLDGTNEGTDLLHVVQIFADLIV